MPKKIEDLLDWKHATEYSINNHHFVKVMHEVLGNHDSLFRSFTHEIKASEQFRADIASSLSGDTTARPKIAERWVIFLKPRINVLEYWSGMCTAFAAIYGLAGTLFTLLATATDQVTPTAILISFVLIATPLLIFKFYIDKRVFWYKFVIVHLEAIAHGANLKVSQIG
ncbi:MAG: hypothetical protein Q7J38_11570 [Gallionella sp.]|nr:hypothetical protein [Gallionella sp.]